MKDRHDFSKGKRSRVVAEPEPEGKVRITIRLDQDIVDHFLQMAEASGGATEFQMLINVALREYLDGKAAKFEDALPKIERGMIRLQIIRGMKTQARMGDCYLPLTGPIQAREHVGKSVFSLIVQMSSSRLFLDRVARQQVRLRFTG